MDAKALYTAGQLADATTAALTYIKSKPTDVGGRLFLAELFCFQAEWDRAEKQLDTAAQQSQDDGFFALLMRQLIRGEILREQVFTEGRSPNLVGELSEDARLQLELCAVLRSEDKSPATELLEQAAQARTAVKGTCNGQSFDDIRDLDDRIAGVLEVITATGKYYWVPWKSLRTLELSPPERPSDLLWRKAEIDVVDGPEGQVFIPVRYPCPTSAGWDDQLRLGRATTWAGDDPGPIVGLGQRMLLVGEESIAWMDVQRIEVQQDS